MINSILETLDRLPAGEYLVFIWTEDITFAFVAAPGNLIQEIDFETLETLKLAEMYLGDKEGKMLVMKEVRGGEWNKLFTFSKNYISMDSETQATIWLELQGVKS